MYHAPTRWGVTVTFPTSDRAAVKAMVCRLTGGDDADYDSWCREARRLEPCPYNTTEDERIALQIYTSTDAQWYERINRELRELNPGDDVRFFAQLLNEALEKLPRFEGQVYRGMTVPDLDIHINDYEIDVIVPWAAFTSSSRDITKAFEGNVLFIITSQNGRVLGGYADKPAEEEVLFCSGCSFRVLAAERRDGLLIISVAEATQ